MDDSTTRCGGELIDLFKAAGARARRTAGASAPPESQHLREAIREVIAPTIDAWRAVGDAADETEDDAELGRRVRSLIQRHAAAELDRAYAHMGLTPGTAARRLDELDRGWE